MSRNKKWVGKTVSTKVKLLEEDHRKYEGFLKLHGLTAQDHLSSFIKKECAINQ